MSEYNAYDAFHESLNATGVLSPTYKRSLSAILGKAMEQAANKGREQGKTFAAREHADALALVQERRDELLRANADLLREVRALKEGRAADEATIQTLLSSTRRALEDADKLREIISEQPDNLREVIERDFNDATPQERDAIKRARSLGVVSTRLQASIDTAQKSGLYADQSTPARLRDLGARAFILARRRDGFGS